MQLLASYLSGSWSQGSGSRATLVNPATEAPLAEVATGGHDLAAAFTHARAAGARALGALTFAQRGALVAHRLVELFAPLLPAGALQLLVGPAGALLDHVGPGDVVAFTGGSATARSIRAHERLVHHSVRINIEADSLNAAILGPDVELSSEAGSLFVADVVRDLTQKTGQKCTAIRRVL